MASFASVLILESDPHLASLVYDDDFILEEEDQFLAAELVEEACIRATTRAKRRRVALASNRQGFWETEVMSGSFYDFHVHVMDSSCCLYALAPARSHFRF